MKTPDFSATLLAGLLIKPLPLLPLNRALQHVMTQLCHRRPAIIKRLNNIIGSIFLITPTDLPFCILLTVKEQHIQAKLTHNSATSSDVRIYGTAHHLCDMLQGNEDGDALFFSRHLTVEGDTEALVTLRNALDSEDINILHEISSSFGIFNPLVNNILQQVLKRFTQIEQDLSLLHKSIIAPITYQYKKQAQEIQTLQQQLTSIKTLQEKQQQKIERLHTKVAA